MTAETPSEPEYFLADAAIYAGTTPDYLRKLISDGQLRASKWWMPGGRYAWRVPRSEVERLLNWLDEKTVGRPRLSKPKGLPPL